MQRRREIIVQTQKGITGEQGESDRQKHETEGKDSVTGRKLNHEGEKGIRGNESVKTSNMNLGADYPLKHSRTNNFPQQIFL